MLSLKNATEGDILNLFFEEFAEEHMIQPTFVIDHPIRFLRLQRNPKMPIMLRDLSSL